MVHSYNQEDYIAQCLEGILFQDFQSEILIIDDCSSDGTLEICRIFQEKYPEKIDVVTSSQNEYQQGKLVGLKPYLTIQTKYIAWCDGDDYWIDSLKLRKQIEILESHPRVGIIHSDYLVLSNNLKGNEIIERPRKLVKNAYSVRSGKDLINGNNIKHSTAMIATQDIDFEFIGGSRGIFAGDWLTYISAAQRKTIHFMNEKTTVVRISNNGMWNGVSTETHREQKNRLRWYCATNLPESDLRNAFRRKILIEWVKSDLANSRVYKPVRPLVMSLRKLRAKTAATYHSDRSILKR